MFSFIGLLLLPFLLFAELTNASALLTGLWTISWKYCLALGLGTIFPGSRGVVLCEGKHLREKVSRLGTLYTTTFCLLKSRDLGTKLP